MLLEFDDICEIREGSTCLRHGETAVGSEALTEGFCSTRRCVWPKTLIFVQGRLFLQLRMGQHGHEFVERGPDVVQTNGNIVSLRVVFVEVLVQGIGGVKRRRMPPSSVSARSGVLMILRQWRLCLRPHCSAMALRIWPVPV